MERIEWIQSLFDTPAENVAGEVVDHGVQVDARAIDEPDDTRVDVPVLVGALGADANLRLRRVHPLAWPAPSPLLDETRPGHRMREDLPGPLCV